MTNWMTKTFRISTASPKRNNSVLDIKTNQQSWSFSYRNVLRFICIRLVMLVYLFSTNLVMAFRSPNIFRSPYFTSFITSLSNGVPDVKAQSILRLEIYSNDSYTKFWQLSFDWGNLSIQLHWKSSVPFKMTKYFSNNSCRFRASEMYSAHSCNSMKRVLECSLLI